MKLLSQYLQHDGFAHVPINITSYLSLARIDNSMGLITVNNDALKLADDIISLYNNTERLIKIYNDSPQFISKYFSLENARVFVDTYIN